MINLDENLFFFLFPPHLTQFEQLKLWQPIIWSISCSPGLTLLSCTAALIGPTFSYLYRQWANKKRGRSLTPPTDWSNQNHEGAWLTRLSMLWPKRHKNDRALTLTVNEPLINNNYMWRIDDWLSIVLSSPSTVIFKLDKDEEDSFNSSVSLYVYTLHSKEK